MPTNKLRNRTRRWQYNHTHMQTPTVMLNYGGGDHGTVQTRIWLSGKIVTLCENIAKWENI